MAPSILHPPSQLSPSQALELSQRAPQILKNSPSSVSSSALGSIFSSPESTELWLTYENLLLSCLRTGDEPSAHECLARLVKRFGDDNERIMAFRGLLKEAEASNNAELEKILKEYDEILASHNTNIVSGSQPQRTCLSELLIDYSPSRNDESHYFVPWVAHPTLSPD